MMRGVDNLLLKVIFFLTLVGVMVMFVAVGGRFNLVYFTIHFTIAALAILHLMSARAFDLGASFSFFSLFFFGIVPLLEYRLGVTYNASPVPSDASYLIAGGLALLSSASFYAGYGIVRRRSRKALAPGEPHAPGRRRLQLMRSTSLLVALGLAFYIARFFEFSFENVFYRGFGEQIEQTAMGYSVVNFFARPLLFNLAFLVILMRAKHRIVPEPSVWLAVAAIAVFVSPVGIPRSLAGALYIPLLIVGFVPRWQRKFSILSLITLAILIAAPMVDVFRLIYARTEYSVLQNFRVDYFFSGHFDPFHNLTQVVDRGFASNGWQVVGALLFWVPRSIWPGKPQGTSFEFAEFAGLRSANVSFPLTAEFYVDFGVLGILVGMLGLGLAYKYLDNLLSTPVEDALSQRILTLAHLELSILGIYLLRGSLMSTFAYTAGVALSLMALWKVNRLVARLAGVRRQPRLLPNPGPAR